MYVYVKIVLLEIFSPGYSNNSFLIRFQTQITGNNARLGLLAPIRIYR